MSSWQLDENAAWLCWIWFSWLLAAAFFKSADLSRGLAAVYEDGFTVRVKTLCFFLPSNWRKTTRLWVHFIGFVFKMAEWIVDVHCKGCHIIWNWAFDTWSFTVAFLPFASSTGYRCTRTVHYWIRVLLGGLIFYYLLCRANTLNCTRSTSSRWVRSLIIDWKWDSVFDADASALFEIMIWSGIIKI